MEAESQLRRFLIGSLSGLLICLLSNPLSAADLRTQNFIVRADDPQLARAVAQSAERFRKELAMHWLGQELRPWPNPCPIHVVAGPNLAAQGVTTYNPQPVRDFQMEVVGTPERILDSVLPHEITHTILATYFGRPLPRWADEGICTTVEHSSERNKHEAKLREFLRSRRGIAMNQLFLLKDYPSDVLPMYAQGYSVCRFLIGQKGPRTFIQFLQDYMRRPSWTANVKKHYGYDSLAELQEYWLAWVGEGSGEVDKFAKIQRPAPAPPVASVASVASRNVQAPPVASVASRNVQASATTDLALSDARGQSATTASGAALPLGSSTVLADASADGWYQRKSLQAQAMLADPAAAAPTRFDAPPSVRNSGRYKSSQVRPEQAYSRPSAPDSRVSGIPIDAGRFR